jgi:hypothetical protein
MRLHGGQMTPPRDHTPTGIVPRSRGGGTANSRFRPPRLRKTTVLNCASSPISSLERVVIFEMPHESCRRRAADNLCRASACMATCTAETELKGGQMPGRTQLSSGYDRRAIGWTQVYRVPALPTK